MTPLLTRAPTADRQFERMYQRHVADVYRYALVVLRNPHDAEDVTQTTFMNAYRAMQKGERPEKAQNWLITIAHNVCRQRFRQAQRRPQESEYFDETTVVEEPESTYSAEDLQRALGLLAFNQRAALVMRELEGRSYAEIAEIMGLSVPAVETVIFRARRALREQLESSLTCAEAERFLSRKLDGELARAERGQLRAHLRECSECAALARSQRATRGALKSLLGGLPLPASLLGGGGSSLTLGIAAKAAAVVCAGAVVGTGGYEAAKQVEAAPAKAAAASPSPPVVVSRRVAAPAAVVAEPVAVRAAVRRAAASPKTASRHVRARAAKLHVARTRQAEHSRSGENHGRRPQERLHAVAATPTRGTSGHEGDEQKGAHAAARTGVPGKSTHTRKLETPATKSHPNHGDRVRKAKTDAETATATQPTTTEAAPPTTTQADTSHGQGKGDGGGHGHGVELPVVPALPITLPDPTQK